MADAVIEQIKTELGRTSTVSDEQLVLWVEDARRLIQRRVDLTGKTLAPSDLEALTRFAVVAHARNPSGAAQYDVAVDDARVSRRVSETAGRVTIGDDLWADFDLDLPDFSGGWSGSIAYAGSWRD